MNIALDYDDTYTKDPDFWEEFIHLCKHHNYNIQIITKRGPSNQGTCPVTSIPVVYTDRRAKAQFCSEHGIHVDIWIDDSPQNLYTNG